MGKIIPDLHWTIKDIWTSGNRIVVRGEATGTPTGELYGVKPTGKSFKTISIDMFTVRDGKLATAYHVENWMDAMEQIKQGGLYRATFLYNPNMAASAVNMARLIGLGRGFAELVPPEVPRQVVVPAAVVTKDNVSQYEQYAFD